MTNARKMNMGEAERAVSIGAAAALGAMGLRWRGWAGALTMLGAGELLRRGVTGHCFAYDAISRRKSETASPSLVRVANAITLNVPREAVYSFWRDVENLPKVMHHLESVTDLGEGESLWRAKGLLGRPVEWTAQIVDDVPNERIGWRSVANSEVENSGAVYFEDAPANQGTEVYVEMQYAPPAGRAGDMLASLLGKDPQTQMESALLQLRQYLEAGHLATVDGQTQGGRQRQGALA